MNAKGHPSSNPKHGRPSHLTPSRSTTSNRLSHAPPTTASVNQGVAISARAGKISSLYRVR
jgi:hypothetical protein